MPWTSQSSQDREDMHQPWFPASLDRETSYKHVKPGRRVVTVVGLQDVLPAKSKNRKECSDESNSGQADGWRKPETRSEVWARVGGPKKRDGW